MNFLIYIVFIFSFSLINCQDFTVECPKGKVNCTQQCGRYIDANGDTICDLSIPKYLNVEKAGNLIEAKIDINKNNITSNTSKVKIKEKKIFQNVRSVDTLKQSTNLPKIDQAIIIPTNTPKKIKNKPKYHFISLTLATFLLYFLSKFMYKKNVITITQHRQFWNTILLLTFMFSGLLGLYLVVQINYDIKYRLPFDIYLFHVDFGIVMGWLSIIHVWWHLKYYKNYLFGDGKNKKN